MGHIATQEGVSSRPSDVPQLHLFCMFHLFRGWHSKLSPSGKLDSASHHRISPHIFFFLFCETQFQSCQDIQALSCFLFSFLSKRFSICNFSSVTVIFLSSFPVFPPWISSVLRLPSVPQSAAASLELHITHVSLFSLDGPISKASHKFLPSLMFLPRPSSVLSFACLVSAWSPHKHDVQLILTL